VGQGASGQGGKRAAPCWPGAACEPRRGHRQSCTPCRRREQPRRHHRAAARARVARGARACCAHWSAAGVRADSPLRRGPLPGEHDADRRAVGQGGRGSRRGRVREPVRALRARRRLGRHGLALHCGRGTSLLRVWIRAFRDPSERRRGTRHVYGLPTPPVLSRDYQRQALRCAKGAGRARKRTWVGGGARCQGVEAPGQDRSGVISLEVHHQHYEE